MNFRWSGAVLVALLALNGCAAGPDVEISGPALRLDVTNSIMPLLTKELPSHPSANTFRVTWSITPDPKHPLESLPHELLYDRKTKTLSVHRDRPQFERYLGVTDAMLQSIASKNGVPADLMNAGCSRQSLPEK
jgi:hypothetical protein